MHNLASILGPQARFIVLGIALGLMALEYGASRLAQRDNYDLKESGASLGVALGQNLLRGAEALLVAVPFTFVYAHRLLTFDQAAPLALVGLFVGAEFFYYWQHRASHRIRWFWATHSVHHSATRLNFTAAIRLGWTGAITGNFLFFLPLAWIGFHPLAITAMLGLNLLYQFFIHTELVRRLGVLEWVLNTPAHHRVHHASNADCLDKNYGGVLIVFDRLFGTFTEGPHGEPLRYGLVGGVPTLNPFRIALGEWRAIYTELRKAKSARRVLAILFSPPSAFEATPRARAPTSLLA